MDVIINADTEFMPSGSTPLVSSHNYLLHLMMSLGFQEENPPIADFLRQLHQLEGEWLLAEPVHWEASHNDAMIVAAGNQLQLTFDESQSLFRDIATFLAEDGLSLHYHNAYTWLMKVDGKAELASKPTCLMLNQSMMSVIKNMDSTLYWQRLMTELQMFLNSHAFNQYDMRTIPVNGLWIYGQGAFSWNPGKPVMTDDEQLLAAFPSNMTRMKWDEPVSNKAIIVISNYEKLEMMRLLALIGNQPVRWFWNNIAWSTPRKSWWARLRGFC